MTAPPAVAPVVHQLKTYPGRFRAMKSGRLKFDIREDRGYAEGHHLLLREWDAEELYTGDELLVKVTYISRGPDQSLARGIVVMSIEAVDVPSAKGDHAADRRRRDALGAEDL